VPRDSFARARLLALLLPAALMLGALGSQFIGGLVPCEMCMWQRWPHLAAIAVALLAFFVPGRATKVTFVLFAGVLIALSGAIGVFHAGVEYHWWPGITECTAPLKPGASGMDILSQIAHAPLVRCDVAQWNFAGISLAGFNAIFSLIGAAAVFVLATRRARA
jgi:disulfide bond formation protein DsbB